MPYISKSSKRSRKTCKNARTGWKKLVKSLEIGKALYRLGMYRMLCDRMRKNSATIPIQRSNQTAVTVTATWRRSCRLRAAGRPAQAREQKEYGTVSPHFCHPVLGVLRVQICQHSSLEESLIHPYGISCTALNTLSCQI